MDHVQFLLPVIPQVQFEASKNGIEHISSFSILMTKAVPWLLQALGDKITSILKIWIN